MTAAWPDAFLRAREWIDPVLKAYGLRTFGVEQDDEPGGSAFAEYRRAGLRVRLVWEGREQALWVEHAREVDAQIVSRWTDVEWSVAGERLPLDTATDDARLDRLATAVARFLAGAVPGVADPPAPGTH